MDRGDLIIDFFKRLCLVELHHTLFKKYVHYPIFVLCFSGYIIPRDWFQVSINGGERFHGREPGIKVSRNEGTIIIIR